MREMTNHCLNSARTVDASMHRRSAECFVPEPRSHLQQESGSLPRWLRGREDESRRPSRGDPSERHNLVLQAGAVCVGASLPEQHVTATMILVIWGGMAVVLPCAALPCAVHGCVSQRETVAEDGGFAAGVTGGAAHRTDDRIQAGLHMHAAASFG